MPSGRSARGRRNPGRGIELDGRGGDDRPRGLSPAGEHGSPAHRGNPRLPRQPLPLSRGPPAALRQRLQVERAGQEDRVPRRHRGAEAFYDSANISRADAHPFPLVDMFGGINMEMYDGPRHLALKSMALSAFDHGAIRGYLPATQARVESTLARLSAAGEFSAVAELRRLAIEAICSNLMGLEPGAATEAITRDYALVLSGILSVPIPLPGTPKGKGRAARDRLLERIRGVIAERRARPGRDGLSRMLTATAADGRTDRKSTRLNSR